MPDARPITVTAPAPARPDRAAPRDVVAGNTPAASEAAADWLRPGSHPAVAGSPPPTLRSGQVLALGGLAGNRAVAALLAPSQAGRGRPHGPAMQPSVQREGEDDEGQVEGSEPEAEGSEAPAADDTRSPEERVDDATFAGFNEWADAAITDADEACVTAEEQSHALSSPYRERMETLIEEVVAIRNAIDEGVASLGAGGEAPGLTADPQGALEQLEDRASTLADVCDAWSAVVASGILELLARVGEARLAQARRVRDELAACQAELQTLQRIAAGDEMMEAFAQAGIGVALTAAGIILTAMFPPAGLAIAVGSAVVGLTLDAALGPTGPDALDFGAGGASTAGAAVEQVAQQGSRLTRAGSALGAAGAVAGTTLDVLESREAIDRYEAAAVRVRVLAQRLNRLAQSYEDLRPILEHPAMLRRILEAMRARAQVLRDEGQIVLEDAGIR